MTERHRFILQAYHPEYACFRVKAGPFLKLTGNSQEREHILRADQIKDVNGLLVENIDVVSESQ